ncbi:Uncharacterised protein [Mycobacteroides abscessus subsp. abscessus]|nr:Uncharacterised protein [Mycobacteroides abscessus subsp. abscessus]
MSSNSAGMPEEPVATTVAAMALSEGTATAKVPSSNRWCSEVPTTSAPATARVELAARAQAERTRSAVVGGAAVMATSS